jgi:ribosome biogenesis GTPase / thiamine phosphate phosphatase
MTHTLEQLGWIPFFEKQLSAEDKQKFAIARVISEHKSMYTLSNGSQKWLGKLAGKYHYQIKSAPELPVTGDWVLITNLTQDNVLIERCLPRKSQLTRRRPADRGNLAGSFQQQILASNLDIVFIVTSLNQDFSPARIARTTTMVWDSGATPVILLSKSDLCETVPEYLVQAQEAAPGVDIHAFSNTTQSGINSILPYLKTGKTICLLGSSGVGKSTLINTLSGTAQKTLDIRADDAKGRHATTSRNLFVLSQGGILIDTPGLREIGLWGSAESLSASFPDIETLADQCKFKDCTHQSEPHCAVQLAVIKGSLQEARLSQYQKLRKELDFYDSKHSTEKMQEAKRKQKELGKLIKEVKEIKKSRYKE